MSGSRRTLRIAEAIRETLAQAILFEINDPRIQHVTVLGCEVSEDMHDAIAAVSIMGTDLEQAEAMRGLESARGWLQRKVASRLQTRTTPRLRFKRDDSVKKSVAIGQVLNELAARRDSETPEPSSEPAEEDSSSPPSTDSETERS